MNQKKRWLALFLGIIMLMPILSLGAVVEEKSASAGQEKKKEEGPGEEKDVQEMGQVKLESPSEKEGMDEDEKEEKNMVDDLEEGDSSLDTAPTSLLPKIHFGGPVYRNAGGKNITQVYLKDVAPWSFYHVWDRTLDPITGSTQYMVYFKTDQGDYAFCMNPGLDGPEGNLPELFFPESPFKKRCEAIATVGLSSGGIEGYSFEENFIFSQMYIWSLIPMEDGSPRYELSFRKRENWVEINDEIMDRFAHWKTQVDERIARLGEVSFQGETYALEVGEELVLIDSHGQLEKLTLRSQIPGLEVEKNGNELRLKAREPFDLQSLEFAYAAQEYPLPMRSFLLQGHDDRYQDLAGFGDPYRGKVFLQAKESKGRFRIVKKDLKDRVIPGALFEVARDQTFSQILESLSTDEQGIAFSKEYSLSEGSKVYLREKSVPEPYLCSGEVKEVTLVQGETQEVNFVNESKKVILKKVDALSGEGIAGAKIRLSKDQKDMEYITDEKGEILLEDLFSGDYRFREISAPTGYVVSSKEHQFTLREDGSVEGSREWSNVPRRLKIMKADGEKGLAGAVFELFYVDEGGKEEKIKASFSQKDNAYNLTEEGDLDRFVSDEKGEILFQYLPLGTYRLVEVQAPSGYLLGEKGIPQEHLVQLEEEGREEFLVQLNNEKTTVVLRKKDGKRERMLEGVDMEISGPQGTKEVHRTNEKGEITLRGLPSGEYSYREILAPLGYESTREKLNFTISENGLVQGEFIMINHPRELIIQKLQGEKPLPGALYELLKEDQKEVLLFNKVGNEYDVSSQGTQSLLESDEKGEIHIFYLPQGNYYLREVRAPQGYVLDQEIKKIQVQGQLTKIQLQNKQTQLMLRKIDGLTKKVMGGVELHLREKNGETKSFKTDNKGEIHLLGLNPGDYEILEPHLPPGYVPLPQQIKISLKEDGTFLGESAISNMPTGVMLQKSDEKGNPLEKVGFHLFSLDEQGNKQRLHFRFDEELKSFVPQEEGEAMLYTDKEGGILLHYLPLGQYLLEEVDAPKGYLPVQEKKFFVQENHTYLQPAQVELVNRKEPLPSTGEEKSRGILLLGIFFSLGALLVLKRKRAYSCKK